ncbi:ectoine/hydroxyectoine ABC transporter permease subunit EhuC [Sporolactobacillus terrae]|uniref:ectoine/hydroxyectoine ABC transporter permease subunit EhuC n=1 Tax=Sporolactobacillus terrae TaxID=269673 RepID=UPI0006883944|nr:ectoine/hydroxyectoine ABC transporter permease subunit EhuC [Sporolactobacillus terrae]
MVSNIAIFNSLLKGLAVTLQVLGYSVILALGLSFIFGFLSLSKWKMAKIVSHLYIEIFRGTSLLVQLFWLYFSLPILGIQLPAMLVGVLGLGLNYGAYGAVVVKTSIQAVPKGQFEASVALNMSPFRRMRSVILPQAFLIMLPTFSNLTIELLKGTSLVSLVTLSDLTFQAMALRSATMETVKIFTILLILYFIVAYPITLAFRWLEKKLSVGRG